MRATFRWILLGVFVLGTGVLLQTVFAAERKPDGPPTPLIIQFKNIPAESFVGTLMQLGANSALGEALKQMPISVNREANAVVILGPPELIAFLTAIAKALDQPNEFAQHQMQREREEAAFRMKMADEHRKLMPPMKPGEQPSPGPMGGMMGGHMRGMTGGPMGGGMMGGRMRGMMGGPTQGPMPGVQGGPMQGHMGGMQGGPMQGPMPGMQGRMGGMMGGMMHGPKGPMEGKCPMCGREDPMPGMKGGPMQGPKPGMQGGPMQGMKPGMKGGPMQGPMGGQQPMGPKAGPGQPMPPWAERGQGGRGGPGFDRKGKQQEEEEEEEEGHKGGKDSKKSKERGEREGAAASPMKPSADDRVIEESPARFLPVSQVERSSGNGVVVVSEGNVLTVAPNGAATGQVQVYVSTEAGEGGPINIAPGAAVGGFRSSPMSPADQAKMMEQARTNMLFNALCDDFNRAEIGLSADREARIAALVDKYQKIQTSIQESARLRLGQEKSPDAMTEAERNARAVDMAEALGEAQQAAQPKLEAIRKEAVGLLTEEEKTRLQDVTRSRWRFITSSGGLWALASKKGQQDLGLSDTLAGKIKQILDETANRADAMRKEMATSVQDVPAERRGEVMRDKWQQFGKQQQEIGQKARDAALALLTADQRPKAQEMMDKASRGMNGGWAQGTFANVAGGVILNMGGSINAAPGASPNPAPLPKSVPAQVKPTSPAGARAPSPAGDATLVRV